MTKQDEKIGIRAGAALLVLVGMLSLLFCLAIVLLPYELDGLRSELNRVGPEKLTDIADIAFPELRQLTLDDVKLGCTIIAGLNFFGVNPLEGLPLGQKDQEFVCAGANSASGIQELKLAFATYKLKEMSDEYFPAMKEGVVGYYGGYMLPLALLAIIGLAGSAFLVHILESEMFRFIRMYCLHFAAGAFTALLLVMVVWLLSPSLVENDVKNNPAVQAAIALVPEAQKPVADIILTESILLLSLWVEGYLVHLMLVFIALSAIGVAGFIMAHGMLKAREEKEGIF